MIFHVKSSLFLEGEGQYQILMLKNDNKRKRLKVLIYNHIKMSRQHHKRFLLTGQDKYNKITHKNKILLIKRVILDEGEIKETAQALKINYSTAKTLMRKFKRHGEYLKEEVILGISRWYEIYSQEKVRCDYRAIEINRSKKYEKKEKKSQQEETEQHQYLVKLAPPVAEAATPIRIYQQVLFRQ